MNCGAPDRRSYERFPTLLEGWITSETNGEPIPCTVWDLSETGVCLIIPPPC